MLTFRRGFDDHKFMVSGPENKEPELGQYQDYREYLRDVYAYLKGNRPQKFSYRAFSKAAGFASPNFLKLVIEGKRNLSQSSIDLVAGALKLSREEHRLFRSLVLFNQASSAEDRELYGRKIIRSKRARDAHPLQEAQYNYYAHWYMIPVRELVALKNFNPDPNWIAEKICPKISVSEAQSAMNDLLSLGMIAWNEASGRYDQGHRVLNTENEVSSTAIIRFHHEMIKLGSESIERFPSAKREISAASVGLSQKNILRTKTLIQKFRQELLAIAAEDQDVSQIYQVNFQFFPLSAVDAEEGSA